jgi:hypothetical protein
MKMEQTGCSETLAFKLHTPVNHPYLLNYEDGTECYETLPFKIQTPVNHSYLLAYEDGRQIRGVRWVDFFLFPRLKSIMKGACFADVATIQDR